MHANASLLRGSKLPLALLPSVPDGAEEALVAGRGPLVIVRLHAADCAGCRRYVQELTEAMPRFAEWGGRPVLVVPGNVAEATAVAEHLPRSARVLADPHRTLGRWGPAVIVADEWGEVFFATTIGAGHELPTPAELADWTKYVAIQCEECEMPEGGWKDL